MVRIHTDTQTIHNLFLKNTSDTFSQGDSIKIESDFQRGDEETGVWSPKQRQRYIDSQQRFYPSGILTFVKDRIGATSYNNPWSILDGGNRLRALRDYLQDKYVDENQTRFSDLTPEAQANLKTVQIPCQWITIERNDSPNTIADMFCRLNTSAKPLSQGELFKAHGHRGDIWELELAKKIIGDDWESKFNLYDQEVNALCEKWKEIFGCVNETKRSDNLAMITGYLLSAKEENFEYFDKRYNRLMEKLSEPNQVPSLDDVDRICTKINTFLDIMKEVYHVDIFGKPTKGIPSQSKIAPVWKKICDNTMDDVFKSKMIRFYNRLNNHINLLIKYKGILTDGGNGETTTGKLDNVFKLIEETISN